MERNKGEQAFAVTDSCCVIPVFPRSFLLNQREKYKALCWDLQPVLAGLPGASWCKWNGGIWACTEHSQFGRGRRNLVNDGLVCVEGTLKTI